MAVLPRDNPRLCCVGGEEELTGLDRLGDLDKLFPPSWTPPSSLLEALQQADIHDAEQISSACDVIAESVCSRPTTGSSVSKEDAAVLACYTFDFGPASYEFNPFRVLNTALFERNVLKLMKIRGLLVMLLRALRRQPQFRATGSTSLFRGITKVVPHESYRVGTKITWHTFCSTSLSMEATKSFMIDKTTGVCSGTLFIIKETVCGCDVQPFSFMPENEILLEPEMDYEVTNFMSYSERLTIVELKGLPTPLLLKDVCPCCHSVSTDAEQLNPIGITITSFADTQKANQMVAAVAVFDFDQCLKSGKPSDFEAMVNEMNAGIGNLKTQDEACKALAACRLKPTEMLVLGSCGIIGCVIRAIQHHISSGCESASLCENACNALCTITEKEDINRVIAGREGAVSVVLSVLNTHTLSEPVCESACNALSHIVVAENGVNHLVAVREGAISSVLHMLNKHISAARVCGIGCVTLRKLICNAETDVIARREGAISVVLVVLKQHISSVYVCQRACSALCTIAASAGPLTPYKCYVTLITDSQVIVAREGAISVVLYALNTHISSQYVCYHACEALRNITLNSNNKVLAAREGAISVVLSVLNTHISIQSVCKTACDVISNITHNNTDNKRIAGREGAIGPLLSVLTKHISSESVCYSACAAIWDITCLIENRHTAATLGYQAVINAVFRTHTALAREFYFVF